jgi:hypothetical protein
VCKKARKTGPKVSERAGLVPQNLFPSPSIEVGVCSTCKAHAQGSISCSLCKEKMYCSLMCKVSDMVAHRRECRDVTIQEHVYAYCGSIFPEQKRVEFLKSLPAAEAPPPPIKNATAVHKSKTVPASSGQEQVQVVLNKDVAVRIIESLMELPECFYFKVRNTYFWICDLLKM